MNTKRKKVALVVNNTKAANWKKAVVQGFTDEAERYARVIIAGIKRDPLLSSVPYFSREALLLHFKDSPAFGRVATISRYNMVRLGVSYLLMTGELSNPNESRRLLCLSDKQSRAETALKTRDEAPLHTRYYEVIRSLVSTFGTTEVVDVMLIVRRWQQASPLEKFTEDNLRVLVRQTLRQMVRNKLLRENNDYTYTVLPSLGKE